MTPPSNGAYVTASIASIAFWGAIAIIFSLSLYFRYRRNQLLHETLRAMVEKGAPIPPELLANPARRPRNDLRSGLICVGVGLALFLSTHFTAAALIPLFIGLAFLIVWLVERNDKNKEQPPK